MTLLTMTARVCNTPGVGIAVPTVVIGTSDDAIKELLELANQEGEELALKYDWPVLTKEKTFTTTAAAAQTGAIPSDFGRFVNDSIWNRTTSRQLIGPITPQEWQRQQVLSTLSTIQPAFRIRGSDMLITPTPAASETIAYEYVMKNWCESSGGTDQSAWAADTDVGLLDEDLMVLGIVWRWRKAKGLSYGDAFNSYELKASQKFGAAGGKPTLSLASRSVGGRFNIPDGSVGL